MRIKMEAVSGIEPDNTAMQAVAFLRPHRLMCNGAIKVPNQEPYFLLIENKSLDQFIV